MTKIAIKAESITTSDLFVKALVVLPEAALIAFHTDDGTLYINDNYADAALSYLNQAGITAQVVERGEA
jgi:hypothetical protein